MSSGDKPGQQKWGTADNIFEQKLKLKLKSPLISRQPTGASVVVDSDEDLKKHFANRYVGRLVDSSDVGKVPTNIDRRLSEVTRLLS
ncbi:predicted protein [Botrytis cinerea T4]|uniref:Uncharacterized protein n=1 Tax=Botryotinia fuckeliana (strain T4) TaxID=999810 RepID=G2Y9B8_BOTF4|nr:predicted protein [Botrytis cinerea T4]